VDRTLAQPAVQVPMSPSAQMMGPGQSGTPTGMMMGQMQQQMEQMTATLRAMRAQLDRINPALLTPSERAMYDYLRLMQTQMQTMNGWMGNAQGVMRQMPGTRR
jgi:hypothetical protein